MDELCGKWKFERAENLDAFLKAMNKNIVERAVISKLKPLITISNIGDTRFRIERKSNALISSVDAFDLGEDFQDDCHQCLATNEGKKLVIRRTPKVGHLWSPWEEVYEIYQGQLLVTSISRDVISRRYFMRTFTFE